ncbi:unnamed protein product [Didymodactylos carnosus]|uniref:Uncharacterized protein n=1 Tax=Didymodactylos carnosus TaxID=1234261 RepID=A0A8S2WGA4_9BILA|nr:unnamed protein product [Didymodactylos carnosus]CAF4441411.1 unnamed protein product [Didymodactylos carnosus]
MSESTWTAIRQLLISLIQNKKNKIKQLNIISDSPSSQYRNKTTIYFLKRYSMSENLVMRWIFLESGHGKGVADAIGASVKRMFDDIIRFHPDETYKNAGELMRNVQNSTSIRFYLYAKEDIDAIRQQIPLLTSVRGTSLFHEIIAHPDGKIFAKSKSDDEEKLIKTNF